MEKRRQNGKGEAKRENEKDKREKVNKYERDHRLIQYISLLLPQNQQGSFSTLLRKGKERVAK